MTKAELYEKAKMLPLLPGVYIIRDKRDEIIQVVNVFRASIVDISRETLTVVILGSESKAGALMDLLADFGILEIAKTGTIAIERGRSTIYDNSKLREEYDYGKNVL